MTLTESMDTLRRELAALREAIEKTGAGQRDLYSAEEVAQRLSISLSTVRVLIARGELRYLRIGNLVRVPRSSIDQFCRRNHFEVWGAKDPGTGRTRRPARMRRVAAADEAGSGLAPGRAGRRRRMRARGEDGTRGGHERATPCVQDGPSYHGRTRSEIENSGKCLQGASAASASAGR